MLGPSISHPVKIMLTEAYRHQLYQTRLMRLPTSPEHVTYWYYEENKNLWYRKQHRQKKDF